MESVSCVKFSVKGARGRAAVPRFIRRPGLARKQGGFRGTKMMRWLSFTWMLLVLTATTTTQGALMLEVVPDGSGGNAVQLTGYEDLATYQIEVLISATGLDKTMVQAVQSPSGYVFPDNDPSFSTFTTELYDSVNDTSLGLGEVRVVFSDFYTGPAASGSVTWVDATSPNGIGVITISSAIQNFSTRFLTDGLILNDPNGDPIAGFTELVNNLNPTPIPEPGSISMVLSGAALAVAATLSASLRRKRSHSC